MLSSTERRVAIYEPCADGHRLYYVRILLSEAVRQGLEVALLTRATVVRSAEFRAQIEPLTSQLGDIPIHAGSDWRNNSIVSGSRLLGQLLRHLPGRGGHLVIPDGDRILPQWLLIRHLFRKLTCTILIMRDPWTSRTPTGFVKRLLIQLAMLDRRLSLYVLVPPGASSTSPLPHVEDPVEISADAFDRSEIRRTLALQAESLVAIIGRIDERKNVPLAVEAMRLVVPRVSAQLIVAGVISPGIVDFLDRQRASAPWVHVDNRYLSNAEFDEYIAAADVILAAYENRAGSSGVLSRAAALGTPVVAANIEYGLQLAATGAGIAAEPRAAAVADAIVRALERGRPEVRRDLYSSRRGVDAFAETLLGAPR